MGVLWINLTGILVFKSNLGVVIFFKFKEKGENINLHMNLYGNMGV